MDFNENLYYTSPRGLDHDPQSRGSSSSTQLLSPSTNSGTTGWPLPQSYAYDGIGDGSGEEYKPSLIPIDTVSDNGHLGHDIPVQLSNYQASHFGKQPAQMAGPEGDNQNIFANLPTYLLQDFIAKGQHLPDVTNSSAGYDSEVPQPSFGAVPPQTLFPSHLDAQWHPLEALPRRSPSPLNEIDEGSITGQSTSSPEMDGVLGRPRRASEGSLAKPRRTHNRRKSALLPVEEKLLRAQATEGMNKQDKRRVQNKLAQRAFRARSKVTNNDVQTRLEDLEALTRQQADHIKEMTDLVRQLRTENDTLKSQKH